jgi:phosphate transport system substrate-binding protein
LCFCRCAFLALPSFRQTTLDGAGTDPAKGKILTDFMKWKVGDGQGMTSALDYAPLPANVAAKANAALKQVMLHPQS